MAVKKKTPKQKKTKTVSKSKLKDDTEEKLDNEDITSNDHSEAVEGLIEDCSARVDKLLEAVEAAGLTDTQLIEVDPLINEVEDNTAYKLTTLQTLTSHTNQIQPVTVRNDLIQTDQIQTNTDVVVDSNSNSDYVVEYIVPDSTSEHRANKKRKFLESLREVEECNTKLKKIKVENEELDLDCEWEHCNHNNKSWAKFMEHVRKHIGDTQIRQGEKPEEPDMFLCLWEECGFECLSSGEMVRHINYHSYHTKLKCLGLNLIQLQGLRGCSLDTNQMNIFQDFTDPFKCKWFSCSENYEEFEHPQLFYWHVARHADDATKFDCNWDDCHKKDFASKTRLREHLRSHSQEKQFACPTCGACFATKIKLFDHLKRQQESAANFICSNCNKAFVLERLLRDHMRSHINTYDCEECGMCWPTPSALKTHILYRHSDERAFPCDNCEYKAKSHHDLKQHARSHQGEVLSCMEGCGFVCKSNTVMKHHILKVHLNNSGKYACHLCESVYKRGALLTGHLKKKHNIISNTSRFRYSLDEATGMYRVQLYRYELQDEDKDANLEIDTEVESLYQASPAPSSSTYMASPTPSSLNHPSPAQSSQYQPSPAPSSHYPSPAPHSNGHQQGGGMPIVAVRSTTTTSTGHPTQMADSDWSQEGSSVRSSIMSSVRSQDGSSILSSVRSQDGSSILSSVRSQEGSSILSSVRSQDGSSILSSVRSSVGASVHSQVSVEGISLQSYQDLGYSFPFEDKVSDSIDEEQNIWIPRKFRSSTPDVEIDVTRDQFS